MDVAVVGGGAVGVTAAADLAERGATVSLYDRASLAGGSTSRAAGLCYDAYAGPLDAEIGARAMARFRELGVLTECPYVWLARAGDDETAADIEAQVPRMRDNGRNVALVDPAALGERYPQLETADVAAAAVAREAGYVDPTAYVDAMAERALAAGVAVHVDAPVSLADPTTVVTADGETDFDAVLVAAGPATKPLVADVGVSLALKAYRAQALVTESLRATLPMLYDATTEVYWRPRDGGLLVGDGAHEVDPEDWDEAADESFIETTLSRVRETIALDPSVDRSWAGLCTATPDRDPLVGAVEDGLYVAAGWQGHGFMRAPAIGERVAEEILGGAGVDRFDPTRFAGDEEFDALGDVTLDS